MRKLALTVFCALAVGCGSSSSSVTSSADNPVSPSVATSSQSLAGTWRGAFQQTGQEVDLYLTQQGSQLRGTGLVYIQGDPLPVQVAGTAGEAVQLELAGLSANREPYNAELILQLKGDQAQGRLYQDSGNDEEPADLSLSRAQGLPPLTLPITFRVGSYQVTLEQAGDGEYLGRWTVVDGGQPLVCVRSFSFGVARFGPDASGRGGMLAFNDPSGVLELGTAWVQPNFAVDPDSSVVTAQGVEFLR